MCRTCQIISYSTLQGRAYGAVDGISILNWNINNWILQCNKTYRGTQREIPRFNNIVLVFPWLLEVASHTGRRDPKGIQGLFTPREGSSFPKGRLSCSLEVNAAFHVDKEWRGWSCELVWYGNHLFSEMLRVTFLSWGSLLEHQVLEVNSLWAQQDHAQDSHGRDRLSTSEEGIIKSSQCLTDSLHPSCFAHGDIHGFALLSPKAGNHPPSNRTLDYVPPSQSCGCATRICKESVCILSDSEHQTGSFKTLFQWNIPAPCPKCKQGHWFSLAGFKTYETKLMAGQKNKEKMAKQFIWKCQMVQILFFQASPWG